MTRLIKLLMVILNEAIADFLGYKNNKVLKNSRLSVIEKPHIN